MNRPRSFSLALGILLSATVCHGVMESPGYRIAAEAITSGGGTISSPGYSAAHTVVGASLYLPAPQSSTSPTYILTLGTQPQSGGIRSGDLNGDSQVDIVDALIALKAGVGIVNLLPAEIQRADVSPFVHGVPVGDGKIDIEDAILILRKSVGMSW